MNQPLPFWYGLFAADTATTKPAVVTMKLLKKRGKPLLLVPSQPHLATHALELYPAQTTRSRLARLAANWLLKTRLPVGVDSVQVQLSPDHAFIRWLTSLIQLPPNQIPQFAVLAGNPSSPGQRLIILLFDASGRPAAVVKAGFTEAAHKLIAQEQQFLKDVPQPTPHIPKLGGTFANERLQALALDFLPGRSPVTQDEPSLAHVLREWLQPQKQITFTETRVGRELAAICINHPIFKSNVGALREQFFRAAIYHGDFTPWNIRVSPNGAWTVLDWERGEVSGLPGWDWFHYIVQKSILVEHLKAEAVANRLEVLFAKDEFKTYAQASGIAGAEHALLLLYLLHHAEVVRPAEGLQVTHDLIQHLAAK